MKMKKFIVSLLVVVFSLVIVGCKTDDNTIKHDVRFLDGTNVLKTVQVVEGEKVTRPTELESKTGFEFVNWFSTPSKNHKFDFNKEIVEAVDVYAGFTEYQEDTRDWYLLGSGTSKLLAASDWGKNITDDHKLTKTSGKNEFSITLDLLKDDEFQFGGPEWIHKRGFGYLEVLTNSEGTVMFSGTGGGYGEVTAKGRNIKVEADGNYTFTLKTYPKDDYYNTSEPSYTEESKEIHNIGTYDIINWVRNGDPLERPEIITDFYIKGEMITEWGAMNPVFEIYNNYTKMTRNEEDYTKTIYLDKDDEILFTSTNTLNGIASAGTKCLRYNELDTASQELFTKSSSSNLIVKESGLYTFNYNMTADKLVVTVDKTYVVPEADYYLAGVIGDDSWNQVTATSVKANYKFTKVEDSDYLYEITLRLAEGEEFIIEGLKAGSTERGQYGTEGWNQLGTYNYTYLMKNANFAPFNLTGQYPNYNVKPLVSSNYRIVFNSYSKIITIESVEDIVYDIYIKGSGINDWKANFGADWKFTQSETNPNQYEYEIELEGTEEFGMELHNEGATTGYGTFLNKLLFGEAEGNVNAKFMGATNNNFKASEAGTFKIVVDASDINNVVVNIFLVS